MPSMIADDADREWLRQVRPPDWPAADGGAYDLVVIGGGTAGLVSAMGAAGLGARVALVERDRLGGDCLNAGCVPSKALLRSARAVRDVLRAPELGVPVAPPTADFAAIMRRMRVLRAGLAHHDSAARLAAAGVHVFFGAARFTSAREVTVNGACLRFRRAVVATGGRPVAPGVPGLSDVGFLTSDQVFDLTDLPCRMLVIGAGPIGCELAQAFACFGSTVTLVDAADRVLPREDPDASAILARHLAGDGVRVEVGVRLQRMSRGSGGVSVVWQRGAMEDTCEVDVVFVAAGRAPNIENLGLDEAGIRVGPAGIDVSARLRTTNRRVFAAGDVAAPWKFTHAADATARLVLQNALFFGRRRVADLVIPWCTYTGPEVAHVGVTHEQVASGGLQTVTVSLADVDRAVLDGTTDGFVRLHHRRGRILGATIVAPHAGDLVAYVAHVIRHAGTLGDLAAAVSPYPTYADALRMAGDTYRRTLLTKRVRGVFRRYFAVARGW